MGAAATGGDAANGIKLHAFCLNGEGCTLKVSSSTLGREVVQMVSRNLPRRGARPTLQHLASPLMSHQTLQEQGMTGETATLSCTYIPLIYLPHCD
eukprot:Skav220932  [mRNA]  locus=scaffold3184:220807:221094:+ [translate_table: standard]